METTVSSQPDWLREIREERVRLLELSRVMCEKFKVTREQLRNAMSRAQVQQPFSNVFPADPSSPPFPGNPEFKGQQ
jgi:hypothetical protein